MEVEINNFRTYKSKHIFKFNRHESTLITGESGTGKTTIFDAISWCLFGNYRKISETKRANVIVRIIDLEIEISRFTKPNILTVIYQNKEYIDDIGQSIIEKVIGSRTIWNTACYLNQKSINPLLSSSAKEKLSIISQLSFNGDDPNNLLVRISEKQKSIDSEIKLHLNSLNTLKKFYNHAIDKILPYKDELNNKFKIIEKYDKIEKYLNKYQEKYALESKNIEKYQELKSSISEDNVDIDRYKILLDIKNINTEINNLKLQFNNSKEFINNFENVINSYLSLINNYEEKKLFESTNRSKYYTHISNKNRYTEIKDNTDNIDDIELNKYELILYLKSLDEELIENIYKNNFDISTTEFNIENLKNSYNKYKEFIENKEKLDSLKDKIKNIDIKKAESVNEFVRSEIFKVKSYIEKGKILIPVSNEEENNATIILEQYNKHKSICDNLNIRYNKYQINSEITDIKNKIKLLEEKDNSLDLSTIHYRLHLSTLKSLSCPECSTKLIIDSDKLVKSDYQNLDDIKYLKHQEYIHKNTNNLNLDTCKEYLEKLESIEIVDIENSNKILLNTKKYKEWLDSKPNHSLEKLNNILNNTSSEIKLYNITSSNIYDILKRYSYEDFEKLVLSYNEKFTKNIRSLINGYSIEITDINDSKYSYKEFEDKKTKYTIWINNQKELKTLKYDDEFIQKYEEYSKYIKDNFDYIKDLKTIDTHLEIIENYTSIFDRRNTLIDSNNITDSELEKNYTMEEYENLNVKLILNNKLKNQLKNLQFDIKFLDDYKYYRDYNIKNKNKVKDLIEIDEYLKTVNEYEKIYDEYEKLTNDLQNYISLYDISAKLLSEYLSGTVSTIQYLTNNYLSKIFNNSVAFRLSLDKSSKTSKHTIPSKVNMSIIIDDIEHENINSLSGGELDRLSFCITLALNKFAKGQFLLLDETMSAISSEMRGKCNKILKWEFRQDRFILVINHDDIDGRYDNTIKL